MKIKYSTLLLTFIFFGCNEPEVLSCPGGQIEDQCGVCCGGDSNLECSDEANTGVMDACGACFGEIQDEDECMGLCTDPEAGNCLAKAGLASRTNTLFSIPMLFFMGAARGLGADSTSQAALIASTVIILLIEANAIKGKMGPMASVKGVIHCGLVLTVVLYCSHCFI